MKLLTCLFELREGEALMVRFFLKINELLMRVVAPAYHSLKKSSFKEYPDPYKTITIKVDDVKHFFEDSKIRKLSIPGGIKSGDWDKKIRSREYIFQNSDKYNGLRQHFLEGVPWGNTILFTGRYQKMINEGKKVKGVKTLSELAKIYQKYDDLYCNLKENGLVSHEQNIQIDPIYIYIGRRGEIIYTSNGNHRLYMSFFLGIKTMPVRVWWRHSLWQEIRVNYAAMSMDERGKKYPDLIGHPDLVEFEEGSHG